jgi:hypothetical protein
VLPGRETVLNTVLYARLVTVDPPAVSVTTEVVKATEVSVAEAALSVINRVDVASEVVKTVEVAAFSVLVGAIVLVLVTLV